MISNIYLLIENSNCLDEELNLGECDEAMLITYTVDLYDKVGTIQSSDCM